MLSTKVFSWIFRVVAAIILLQTLFFKFTGAPESVYIFTELGLERWGRIGIGVAELMIGVLLLVPKTAWLGALGGLGVISGAIFAHLTQLGIEVQGDGGTIFFLALTVFISSGIVLWLHRADLVQALRQWNILNNKAVLQ